MWRAIQRWLRPELPVLGKNEIADHLRVERRYTMVREIQALGTPPSLAD